MGTWVIGPLTVPSDCFVDIKFIRVTQRDVPSIHLSLHHRCPFETSLPIISPE